MKKAELRKLYLAKQRSLSPDERIAKSDAIAELFFDSFDLTAVSCLHCFIPIAKFNEVESLRIVGRVWKEFPSIKVVAPRIYFETGEMNSLVFSPDTDLEPNTWDISEPTHDQSVAAKEVDMVLVPGLCFDSMGHRVGYGKGFYDRFLKRCRYDCIRVGLSYFEPVDVIDDVHEGDVRLDAIVTAF